MVYLYITKKRIYRYAAAFSSILYICIYIQYRHRKGNERTRIHGYTFCGQPISPLKGTAALHLGKGGG